MNKLQAQSIIHLRELSSELVLYAEIRESFLKDSLVNAPLEDIKQLQGAVQEVRRLKTLYKEIEQALKTA